MTTEPMTHSAFTQFILRNTWIFAKTYAAFCPHEYVVKERLPAEERVLFEQIVSFIRERGFTAAYGRLGPNRYYTVDEYYYWTMGEPIEEANILNRAKMADYEFRETEKGVIIRFKGRAEK